MPSHHLPLRRRRRPLPPPPPPCQGAVNDQAAGACPPAAAFNNALGGWSKILMSLLLLQVAAVIVGARNASHVADHVRMCSLELDESDLAAIQGVLDRGNRPTSDCYTWERGGKW
jgi:hypothetical protein